MSLNEVWEEVSATPFHPLIDKDSQFAIGFNLLLAVLLFTGIFGLNRSLVNLLSLGVTASVLFGFGAVFMICAVGVYV